MLHYLNLNQWLFSHDLIQWKFSDNQWKDTDIFSSFRNSYWKFQWLSLIVTGFSLN